MLKNAYLIPVAIIIAGGFIGGGLAFGLAGRSTTGNEQPSITLRDITLDDHILGDANAPLTIIEFSDTECPFCKRFHATMQQVVKEYPGKVRWVYRHFPLTQLHSKAAKEAEATECAYELGGNDAFWAYLDRIFEITPSNNNLDPAQLPQIAEFLRLDVKKFNECLESGKYAKKVDADLQDAVGAGGDGTPYTVVIDKKGNKEAIRGAQPYENVKALIESKLK